MTVLFADLKDSTELSKDLDPEAAQQLLDPAIHRMMEAVHRFEGTVNQVPGDGMMALFGAPIAHEGHALRACFVALAMQASMRDYAEAVRRTHGLALRLRVGQAAHRPLFFPRPSPWSRNSACAHSWPIVISALGCCIVR
jgi:class 3 adenylate cyclase